MSWRVGCDIGGTFTDLCAYDDASGRLASLKVLSTPARPGADVVAGVQALAERHGVDPRAVARFTHGTTVGVNTVIQRVGANLALFATEGFTDVLELARLRMPETYGLFCTRPAPLVARERVFPVAERMLADGSVDRPVERASVERAVAAARAAGCAGVVVSLLNAWRNPAHEIEVAALVAGIAPDLFVFRSTEVWPAIREYERTTTAVINAYVHPRVDRYIDALEAGLAAEGMGPAPLITKSNGGVMTARQGRRDCIAMLLSGTASGVMGAAFLARQAGFGDVATLDVGGTSADVALLVEGAPQFGSGQTIGDFPFFVPAVQVSSIGAGGGSIARVDAFGVLKVGPESAGSDPGPAAYGRGGTEATITDACVVLGVLGHDALGFGAVSLDAAAARAAVARLADRLGRSVDETAEAIVRVAVSGMYAEISKLFARAGVDVRRFALMAFGGAGPMLGPLLARELSMRRVLVPAAPGVVCALGGLVADLKNDFIRTVILPLEPATLPLVREGFAALEAEARAWLAGVAPPPAAATVSHAADMRYKGQSYEIEVPLGRAWIEQGDLEAIAGAFHARHAAVFDHADEKARVQLVNLRLVISASVPPPRIAVPPAVGAESAPVPAATVRLFLDGAFRAAPLHRRDALRPGHAFAGPAVVAQEDATLWVPAGAQARVDAFGNILLELE